MHGRRRVALETCSSSAAKSVSWTLPDGPSDAGLAVSDPKGVKPCLSTADRLSEELVWFCSELQKVAASPTPVESATASLGAERSPQDALLKPASLFLKGFSESLVAAGLSAADGGDLSKAESAAAPVGFSVSLS